MSTDLLNFEHPSILLFSSYNVETVGKYIAADVCNIVMMTLTSLSGFPLVAIGSSIEVALIDTVFKPYIMNVSVSVIHALPAVALERPVVTCA